MLELSQPRRLTYRESLSCCVDWAKFFYWLWTNWDAHVNPLLANMPPPMRFRFINKIIYFFERDIREAFPSVGSHLPKITNTVPVPYRNRDKHNLDVSCSTLREGLAFFMWLHTNWNGSVRAGVHKIPESTFRRMISDVKRDLSEWSPVMGYLFENVQTQRDV